MTGPDNQGLRRTDRSFLHRLLRENWYRDLWLLIISILLLYTAFRVADIVRDVQDGRKTAVGISCAATSSVIDAGRAILGSGDQNQNPHFIKNLERLGYPPKKQRDSQAKHLANLYRQQIVDAIAKQVGAHKAQQVIDKHGSLDCAAVRKLSRAN